MSKFNKNPIDLLLTPKVIETSETDEIYGGYMRFYSAMDSV